VCCRFDWKSYEVNVSKIRGLTENYFDVWGADRLLSNDDVITNILTDLFQRMDQEGIEYCVLRDYEGLPESFRSDIDLLVPGEDRLTLQRILIKIVTTHGWLLVKRVRKLGMWQYLFYPGDTDDGMGRYILHIDVFCEILWRGIELLSSRAILRARVPYNDIFVPLGAHEVEILLLKDLLSKGEVPGKYHAKISEYVWKDPEGLHAVMEPIVGQRMAKFLLKRTMRCEWEKIKVNGHAVRWAVVWQGLRRARQKQFVKWLLFLWWGHIREKLIAPTGVFIVVLGSDGSGKTTVIHELKPLMEKLFARTRRLSFNFNTVPHILGDLRDWLRRERQIVNVSVDGKVKDGPRLTPFSTFRALAHLSYHTVGFLLGYPLLFVTRRRGELLIVERYFYNYFIQPSYSSIPRWLLKIVLNLLPKPDATLYLHGHPQLIHDRKPELPVREIERQAAIFRNMLLKIPNGDIIDVNVPVSAVTRQIAHAICKAIKK